MQLHVVDIHDLEVPGNRQRRAFPPEDLIKLADSISQNGLIHPLVVRQDGPRLVLVAGERRLKAIVYVWNFGNPIRCGQETFPEGKVPCLFQGEMEPLAAFEMELEENIRRMDLSWQDRTTATSQLYELRRLQAEKAGDPIPTTQDIADELKAPDSARGDKDTVYKELVVSKYLNDPDVSRADSVAEAFKVIRRKEDLRRSERLGKEVGRTFNREVHTLLHGDCISLMDGLEPASFDVILTDPPYGINAQEFNDSGGRVPGAHSYDDSPATWHTLLGAFSTRSFALAKHQAHAYVFCDIDNFGSLRTLMAAAGWNVFRTPLIWYNPGGMRAPWPTAGPQRKWQMILYAIKGDKNVTRLYGDLITCPSDENLNWSAQKPVDLYRDLLRRSISPGDAVLDPFCGTGTIFPAAHEFKCRATGIEIDSAAYGIAIQRIKDLA